MQGPSSAAYSAPCPAVQLQLLGGFRLQANGRELAGAVSHSAKLKSILCYLILHRDRSVSRDELVDIFYADECQSDPVAALRMQIMRIRQLLKELPQPAILGRRGAYRWNPELSCRVDTEELEQLSLQAENSQLPSQEREALYCRILSLYRGSMALGWDDMGWATVLDTHCHNLFITTAEHYASLLLNRGDFAGVEETCLQAIRHAPTSESLYVILIQAFLQQNRYAEARGCYEQISETLHQQLGIAPCSQLQQLYHTIAQGKMTQQADLGLVIGAMREQTGQKPAFFCDFDQFRSIYQLESRRAPRTGSCLQVVLLTAAPSGRSESAMTQLLQTLMHNLRSSDVVSRYSESQFIIMLPDANLEDSQRVMERVARAYDRDCPGHSLPFDWQIREMEIL